MSVGDWVFWVLWVIFVLRGFIVFTCTSRFQDAITNFLQKYPAEFDVEAIYFVAQFGQPSFGKFLLKTLDLTAWSVPGLYYNEIQGIIKRYPLK